MKEYNTWEVIKMLGENPDLKFETTEVYSNKKITLFNSEGYIRGKFEDIDKGINGNVKPCTKWTLVQEPVDFMTAINSGKDIKSEYWENYKSIRETIACLDKYNNAASELQVINGKWYIRED